MKKETKKNIHNIRERRKRIVVFVLLRVLVIFCMVEQGLKGNWNNVALCVLTLILFTFPTIVSEKFHIEFPKTFESIVYIFIFSAEILGEIQNFYGIFPHWDTMLHTLNGFLCAAVGFSLVDILNNSDSVHINMTPAFATLVAFSFSMTIGVLWEFGEHTVDMYFGKDTQKDRIIEKFQSVKINPENQNVPIIVENIGKTEIYDKNNKLLITIDGGYLDIGLIDTMKDLFVNFIGAIVFSVIGYICMKTGDFKYINKWIPRLKKKEE